MTLKLVKVRGKTDQYQLVHTEGARTTTWNLNGKDVDVSTLQEAVMEESDTFYSEGRHPVVPQIDPRYFPAELTQEQWDVVATLIPGWVQDTIPGLENPGQQAADKAARMEEQRLMNMGSALAKGINMGPEDIPVFEEGMPSVDWSQ